MQIKGWLRSNLKEEHWLTVKRIRNYPRKYWQRISNVLRARNHRAKGSASSLDASHEYIGQPNTQTIDFIATTNCRMIAEIGVYMGEPPQSCSLSISMVKGSCTCSISKHMFTTSKPDSEALGYRNIHVHGNSPKTLDSYNWSLMRMLEMHTEPIYDYVFFNEVTWNVDALTHYSWIAT